MCARFNIYRVSPWGYDPQREQKRRNSSEERARYRGFVEALADQLNRFNLDNLPVDHDWITRDRAAIRATIREIYTLAHPCGDLVDPLDQMKSLPELNILTPLIEAVLQGHVRPIGTVQIRTILKERWVLMVLH